MIWLIRVAAVFLSILIMWNGAAILVTEELLIKLCRRSCLIDSILFILLGNYWGKLIAGFMTIAFGLLVLWYGIRVKGDKKDYYGDSGNA